MRACSVRSLTVLVLAVALLAPPAVLTPTTADAAAPASLTPACPAARVPATAYADTVWSVHRAAIDCASWWELVQGRTGTDYAPGWAVSRAQTAAMLARLLRTTGVAPPSSPSAGFVDTVGHQFEGEIDLLAGLGILRGTSPTTFRPDRPIDRAQMASVLARTFELAYGSPLASGPLPFTDVAPTSVHADAIARIATAGIAAGTSATTYAPTRSVSREQMATFVMRSTAVLVTRGKATPPAGWPAADDAYHARMRTAWVHLFDGALKTRTGIARVVDRLAAADVDVIIAQVARRHDAYYTSSVLPRTTDPTLEPGLDVLAELLTRAHAKGIEVHAWIAVAPTWHAVYADLPAPEGWITTAHGKDAPVAQRWVSRSIDGVWSTYLDPGVLEVQDHVAAVVGELARTYDVDGIHLDYVRYESRDWGYNPKALARYQQASGTSGTPSPANQQWLNWRREQTRAIINRAGYAIDATGKDVEFSAAVITWGAPPPTPDRTGFWQTTPFTTALQDWDAWARAGVVDAVLPMNYFREHAPEQAAWFDGWLAYEQALSRQVTPRVVPGLAGYLNGSTATVLQVERAMAHADGAAIYSYQQPTLDTDVTIWTDLAAYRWRYPPAR
jgi:uncharacterized lipoprotein YddW (UPF0748 family)